MSSLLKLGSAANKHGKSEAHEIVRRLLRILHEGIAYYVADAPVGILDPVVMCVADHGRLFQFRPKRRITAR